MLPSEEYPGASSWVNAICATECVASEKIMVLEALPAIIIISQLFVMGLGYY
jgi:hypothetical protein